MYIITAFILSFSISVGYGFNCRDISGVWQNQLGSNMTIVHWSENQITGEYKTAVETKLKASKLSSNITGMFMPVSDGALLSFSVLFNHGKSLTTWVGQCMVCDGEEILFTSWVLRSHTLKPSDKWMANIMNQDTFKRVRDNYISIPVHLRGPSPKDGRSTTCEKNFKVGMNGHWVSHSNDALEFADCYESGIFSGMNRGTSFVGRRDGGGSFTALGFVSATSNSIKGWTGHIYEHSLERLRTIETSWLSHSFSNSCKDPRSAVLFGTGNYYFTYGFKDTTVKPETSWATKAMSFITSFF